MKKQLAKTISVLSLFLILSISAGNSLAGGGGCSTCKPTIQTSSSSATQKATLTLALKSQEAANSLNVKFLLAELAMGLLSLP